jgi:hypothetical protein
VTDQEEGAVRKQVAVGLVLRLAEREFAVPQVRRAGQEAQRVGGEVELGVGGDPAGRLRERQRQRERGDQQQPAA